MSLPALLLASSSPYRAERLQSLGIPFKTAAPEIDEAPLANEDPNELVLRLARTKARALQYRFPNHLIIGSDQVAVTSAGEVLTKPGSEARAVDQLSRCGGERVRFLTGLCVLDLPSGREYTVTEPFDVVFRRLPESQIQRYVKAERPLDCAGSFKVEGLGITLFERLEGRDPNALIGLPLIALEDGLQTLGYSLMDFVTG